MKYKHILLVLLTILLLTSIVSAKKMNVTNPNDLFDKGEMMKSAKDAWDGGLSGPGYLVLGVLLLMFGLSALGGLVLGGAFSNIGRARSNNDAHSMGNAMMATAVTSVVLVVVGMALISMFFKLWG